MRSDGGPGLVLLVVIAGRKQKDALLCELLASGAKLVSTIYGKGTADASHLTDVLGLVPEDNKAVIACVFKAADVDAALAMLVRRFHFDRPNTGVAFTIDVERLSF